MFKTIPLIWNHFVTLSVMSKGFSSPSVSNRGVLFWLHSSGKIGTFTYVSMKKCPCLHGKNPSNNNYDNFQPLPPWLTLITQSPWNQVITIPNYYMTHAHLYPLEWPASTSFILSPPSVVALSSGLPDQLDNMFYYHYLLWMYVQGLAPSERHMRYASPASWKTMSAAACK